MSDIATLTTRAARDILREARDRGLTGMSRINPQFTSAQVWNVFWNSILMNFDDDLVPVKLAQDIIQEFRDVEKEIGMLIYDWHGAWYDRDQCLELAKVIKESYLQ